MALTLKDFELAKKRLDGIVHKTELARSTTFSDMAGGEVWLKCENRQKTGSFKIRGAANKIGALVERGEVKAVVASSAGNHAQGVARRLSSTATVTMRRTPRRWRFVSRRGRHFCIPSTTMR